jgi:hypothetical protein
MLPAAASAPHDSEGAAGAAAATAAVGAAPAQPTLRDDVAAVSVGLDNCDAGPELALIVTDDAMLTMMASEKLARGQLKQAQITAIAKYFDTDEDFGVAINDYIIDVTSGASPRETLGLPLQFEALALHFRSTAIAMSSSATVSYGVQRGLTALGRIMTFLVRTTETLHSSSVTAMVRRLLGAIGADIFAADALVPKKGTEPPCRVGTIDGGLLFAILAGLVGAGKDPTEAVSALARTCVVLTLCQTALELRASGSVGDDQPPTVGDSEREVSALLSALLGVALSENQAHTVLHTAAPTVTAIALMRAAVLNESCKLPTPLDAEALTSVFRFSSLGDYCGDGCREGPQVVAATIMHCWFGPVLPSVESLGGPPDLVIVPAPRLRTLVDLPREYWEVVRLAETAVCPTTGKAMADPAICLVCGDTLCCHCLMCADTVVVYGTKKKRGACNIHAKRCNGGAGMFLRVKHCTVNLLDGDRGAQIPAPYVDAYGETDVELKRGRPLTFNGVAFAQLVRMFQTNGIPAAITRSLLQEPTQPGFFRAM